MKTLGKKLLITKDQYEDEKASQAKMQAPPYMEEEYWQRRKSRSNYQGAKIKRSDLIKLLAEIKNHENK